MISADKGHYTPRSSAARSKAKLTSIGAALKSIYDRRETVVYTRDLVIRHTLTASWN